MSGPPPSLAGLPLAPAPLRTLAALLRPGAPAEWPALVWLSAAAGQGLAARIGLRSGAALAALAAAAERGGAGSRVLAVPLAGGEPGPAARAVLEEHPEVVELAGEVRGARLLSAHAPEVLKEFLPVLAPGGVVAVDGPAEGPLRAMLGARAPVAALGPITVGVPDGRGALGEVLNDPAVAGPLGAVLGLMGRMAGPGDESPGLGALADARGLAEARLAELGEAQGRTLAAMREADAARAEALRAASRRDVESAAIAEATAAREVRLREAGERIAALEAEVLQLRRSLDERFGEIAVLTGERMAREGA